MEDLDRSEIETAASGWGGARERLRSRVCAGRRRCGPPRLRHRPRHLCFTGLRPTAGHICRTFLTFRKRRDQRRKQSIERSAKAGKPSWSADSGFFASLAELTIPLVAVENAAPVWREVQVRKAVSIVVANCRLEIGLILGSLSGIVGLFRCFTILAGSTARELSPAGTSSEHRSEELWYRCFALGEALTLECIPESSCF